MEKLKTNELSLGLNQTFRNDLVDNFEKIQNGVDDQSDTLNKQITDLLSDVAPQDQNEVTQARIDVHGKPYETLKSREDATQTTAETALSEERDTSAEVQDARTNSNSETYPTLKARMDNQENDLNNSINDKLSQISFVPETFANLAAIKSNYPNGKPGLFVAADDGHKYIWANGSWTDAGIYQSVGIDDQTKDTIGQYLDNLTRNNLVPNGKFQNGNIENVVASVAGVQITSSVYEGVRWAGAKSPSGTVNNQGLGVIFPRLDSNGQVVVGTGTYRLSFRIFTPSNEDLKITLIPRKSNGDWLPSFEAGTIKTHAQRTIRVNNSFHVDISGAEKDFLIMIWNVEGQPVDFRVTDFSIIKEDEVSTITDLGSGYIENVNYGNLARNTFFTDGAYPWQANGSDIAFENELMNSKRWLHVCTYGHLNQSVTYAPESNSEIVDAVKTSGVKGSLILKFKQASVIDIHVIYLDSKDSVLDDIILNTIKTINIDQEIKAEFTIPRVNRPDLARVILILKDHYSGALDFYLAELTLYPVQLIKPDRLTRNVVEDPELKTMASYWQAIDGGSYAPVMKLNQHWIKYVCPESQKKLTSHVEYRYNNEETTNDDFRVYNQIVKADVMVEKTGTYVFRAISYDRNNVKVRDYNVRVLKLKANTINHIEVVVPRMQPDEFTYGIGICTDFNSDLIYYINNLEIMADIAEQTVSDDELERCSNLPRIDITGYSPMEDGDKRNVTFTYKGDGLDFNCFSEMGIQGDSSAAYDKKNFKFKFYADDQHNNKQYFKPKPDWLSYNGITLKANWVDQTHSLNIVSAKIFADITASRKHVASCLIDSGMFGEIQGFPVSLYLNGIYNGLYTFNTKKNEQLFGFGADIPANVGTLEAPNNFKDKGFGKPEIIISEDDETADMMIQVGKQTPEFQEATNRLAKFVSQSDDATFKKDFADYLDLEAVVDFLIFFQLAACSDSYDKNIEYTTYNGKIWLPIPYDLDSTWGLSWDGKTEFNPEMDMFATGLTDNNFENFKINTLLNRTLKNFKPEIKTRYQELRGTSLTPERIIRMFTDYMNEVRQFNYEREASRWPGIPSKFFTFQKVRANVVKRFKVTDYIINNM
ncbi:CotH kinase family protein [Lactiplantibacillus plantarum]|uniref:CotH kinase family protein n=1 Tax=Lactiplantibacillus plantarum TaxID=1590 RepID=UPI0021A97B74|nr:CotH kinase family protein [Lactiplantibacillus plantarum]MCT4441446.1 hypothetical protein [Lactiplantibacillus plantarum]MDP4435947.1 CotH kinase family protein [Lactiplantibacillus plantarum]MDP4438965.1 CotH kinase family protein [Lactiplantibacillus plantarum]MDP4458122.1 CotH kinase family protein [Lactiplantibacillus plantarum]